MNRSESCEHQWDSFSHEVNRILDIHAPIRQFRVHNPTPPPVTDETFDLMTQRRTAKNSQDAEVYRQLNVTVKRAIRKDIRDNISHRVNTAPPSALFRELKSVIAPKRGPSVQPENLTPDQINEYFASVGNKTRESVISEFQESGRTPLNIRLPRVNAGALNLTPITLDELKRIIFSLPNKNSCVTGDIPLKIIKLSFGIIGRTLLQILNCSIVTETVPTSWKRAEVIPLHKKNSPTDPVNFRPITIVPVICKIIEKVVHSQLTTYLKSQSLFSPDQHGFISEHSTATALLTVTDEILKGMDKSPSGGQSEHAGPPACSDWHGE